MTREDYDRYDHIIGMDRANIRNITRICGGDPENKMRRLLDYTARPRDIADPWFTGEFETTWRDVEEGCAALFASLAAE
ncbi:MAG: low molecular weight phosphotyrosine protein phosphatase, partial [Clostridia bacterium]|nr:low molecular weight phosphotyrosine protein phosphatase [Clostridia bacterium]